LHSGVPVAQTVVSSSVIMLCQIHILRTYTLPYTVIAKLVLIHCVISGWYRLKHFMD